MDRSFPNKLTDALPKAMKATIPFEYIFSRQTKPKNLRHHATSDAIPGLLLRSTQPSELTHNS